MIYDWTNTLSENPTWNGTHWTNTVCEGLKNTFGFFPEFLLTAGPGLLQTEAWIFKKHFPNIEIIGFEPQVDRYENLKASFPGKLFNSAISSETCQIEGLMGHLDGETDFKISTDLKNEKKYIRQEVAAVSIDNVLKDRNTNGVVWLDIEGAEFSAVRGAITSMFHEKIRAYSIELSFSDDRIEQSVMLIDMLCKFGYVVMGASGTHHRVAADIEYNGEIITTNYVSEINATKQMHQDLLFCLQPALANVLNNLMYKNNTLYVKIAL